MHLLSALPLNSDTEIISDPICSNSGQPSEGPNPTQNPSELTRLHYAIQSDRLTATLESLGLSDSGSDWSEGGAESGTAQDDSAYRILQKLRKERRLFPGADLLAWTDHRSDLKDQICTSTRLF